MVLLDIAWSYWTLQGLIGHCMSYWTLRGPLDIAC
uniref:Uncharacterized protein n=1 Tax=Anguilla anguilla TaxID=7936 RepID=A0A0E9QGN9_ANGAN